MKVTRMVVLSALISSVLLSGCQTVSNMYSGWFGGSGAKVKIAELTSFQERVQLKVLWKNQLGEAKREVLRPYVLGNLIYAADGEGRIYSIVANTGANIARFEVGTRISGGVGFGVGLLIVGTIKGEVFAYEPSGKLVWKTQLTGEVLSPPAGADGIVAVRTGDGRIYGLNAIDGKQAWIYQRTLPSLSLRSHAGLVIYRGGLFAGFPGGRLAAISLANGNIGWEAVVALPKGTTELERIADITSAPVAYDDQVCTVAYQGRIACFDPIRGETIWARDASSLVGLSLDAKNLYYTDEKSAVLALDRSRGSSLWKQDQLFGRNLTAPLVLGKFLIVADFKGYVHILSREDGSIVGRIATDGSAIQTAPLALDLSTFLVQTRAGGLYAVSLK